MSLVPHINDVSRAWCCRVTRLYADEGAVRQIYVYNWPFETSLHMWIRHRCALDQRKQRTNTRQWTTFWVHSSNIKRHAVVCFGHDATQTTWPYKAITGGCSAHTLREAMHVKPFKQMTKQGYLHRRGMWYTVITVLDSSTKRGHT